MENAIKYGFREIYEGGIITIRIYRDGGDLLLVVYNNGTPIEEDMAEKINALNEKPLSEAKKSFPNQKNGYGVVNVLTRLRLKYGDNVRYRYRAEEDGTTCIIRIPGGGGQNEEE
ncbi:ATP-binding protein [uncultured Treponema sp.]|uniref:sensor histidine kinase n=1 Tax=uncultured Treponema sp. TaxID=162155 RepID=UPI0025EF5FE2|nr:ATP-binding protein [uncultured Treponema sp.]